jgi:hypothetical protein
VPKKVDTRSNPNPHVLTPYKRILAFVYGFWAFDTTAFGLTLALALILRALEFYAWILLLLLGF